MNVVHKPRPWIKVQLSVSPPAEEAAALIMDWKAQRQAAAQIVRAVRLYAGLCQGDLSVLDDYFPGLLRIGQSLPVPPRKLDGANPVIVYSARSDSDDLNDALNGLGLEALEFDAS